MHNAPTPPRWAQWLLTWLHPEDTLEEVQGDLEELYTYWHDHKGKRQAQFRYVLGGAVGAAAAGKAPPQ